MSPSVWRWRACVGLLSLVWLVGLYALAVGGALIVLALRLRGGPPAYRRIWIRRRIGGTL